MGSAIRDAGERRLCLLRANPGEGRSGKLADDLELRCCGVDSLGFATLVVQLENDLGYDPFAVSTELVYPKTLGELVRLYENCKSERKES